MSEPAAQKTTRMGFWRDRTNVPAAPASLHGADDLARLLRNYEDARQGWFWSTDRDGRLTYLTDNVVPLLQPDRDTLVGAMLVDLFAPADDNASVARSLPFCITKQAKFESLVLRAVADNGRCWALSGFPFFDSSGAFAGYRGHGVDVTSQRESSERASQLAMFDPLTELPNRLQMAQVLEARLLACEIQKRPCAVILLDLDRFKQVNDTLGHPAGDALLKQVAMRLRRVVGDRGIVFRLGGDEFEIIVQDCDDRGVLGDFCDAVIAAVSQPYTIKEGRCSIGASAGIAISPFDARTKDDLIRNADLALYAAKESGRGRFRFFATEMAEIAEKKQILEADLRDALAHGEFEVLYQPVVDAATETLTGAEALVRWQHPSLGPISPALFIPIAEEANLIAPLGEWVLRTACEQAVRWPGNIRVAVNVSPIQFASEALPTIVLNALAASGLAPERLELEITEGVFLGQSAETERMFAALKDIGVRLALDDFGTGYSSLGYLRTAPFDKIKIDQSFVREATLPGSRNRAIISAIVALAEAMGMETTAEGIESHDQLDLVRALRVSHIQGYIYSKPISASAMAERLDCGDWTIKPFGPAKQRRQRLSMFRKVGVVIGNRYSQALIRNLSETGALIDGLEGVSVGAPLIVDFGDGQLAYSRVRRARNGQYGVEFEHPLVNDGNGGFCTSHRVSAYQLRAAGIPAPGNTASLPVEGTDEEAAEGLRVKLGLKAPSRSVLAPASFLVAQGGEGGGSNPFGSGTTFRALAEQYLDGIRSDPHRTEADRAHLNQLILPRFGKLRPDDVTPSLVTAWLEQQVQSAQIPSSRVGEVQAIFAQLYMLAMQCGMRKGSDGQEIAVLSGAQVHERRLTPEEVVRLKAAAQSSSNAQMRVMVPLLMLTRTRLRELVDARWDQFDFDAALWHIPGGAYGKERTIKLCAEALAILERLPRETAGGRLIVNPATGKPYRSFADSWNTLRRKAELPDLEMDDLRHCVIGSEQGVTAVAPTCLVPRFLARGKEARL